MEIFRPKDYFNESTFLVKSVLLIVELFTSNDLTFVGCGSASKKLRM